MAHFDEDLLARAFHSLRNDWPDRRDEAQDFEPLTGACYCRTFARRLAARMDALVEMPSFSLDDLERCGQCEMPRISHDYYREKGHPVHAFVSTGRYYHA